MENAYTGGCACGAIRYEIAGEPIVSNDCQCRDCQQESGTGHGSHLTFLRTGVQVRGVATQWDMRGDSGNIKTRAFLPCLRITGVHDICCDARIFYHTCCQP